MPTTIWALERLCEQLGVSRGYHRVIRSDVPQDAHYVSSLLSALTHRVIRDRFSTEWEYESEEEWTEEDLPKDKATSTEDEGYCTCEYPACSDDGLIDSLQAEAAEKGPEETKDIETTKETEDIETTKETKTTEKPEEPVELDPRKIIPAGAESPMSENDLYSVTGSDESEEWDTFCIHCYQPSYTMQGCSSMNGHVFN